MARRRENELTSLPEENRGLSVPVSMADDEAQEIDLLELLNRILDHWVPVAVCAVIGAVIMGVISFFFITPKYQSTAKLYVVNSKDSAINLSDLQIGNYLASDYQEVFYNWHVQERVLEELNLPYSYAKMRSMVSVQNPTNTRILYITVTSTDPQEARDMASTFAKVACEFIAVKMDQTQPNIFEEARVPVAPSSPNKSRNIVIGFLVGMLAAIAVITVQFLMDDKVRTPEDIEKLLGLPTLGVVTEQDTFRHGRRSGGSGKKKAGAGSGGR